MKQLWGNRYTPSAVALDNLLKAHRSDLETSSSSGQIDGLGLVTASKFIEYIREAEAIIAYALEDGGSTMYQELGGMLIQIDCSHLKVTEQVRTSIALKKIRGLRFEYDLKSCVFSDYVNVVCDMEPGAIVHLNLSRAKFNTLVVRGPGYSVHAFDASFKLLGLGGAFDRLTLNNATIDTALWFDHASVAEVQLISTKVIGSFEAKHSRFGELDFGMSTIKKRLVFDHCRFMQPPNVHTTILPGDAIFEKNVFLAPELVQEFKPKLRRGSDALVYTSPAERFRALRLAMKTAGSQDEELRFFALEMRNRRQNGQVAGVERIISWLYDLVSVYGSSTTRAMQVFLLWNVGFCALFFLAITFGPRLHALDIPTGFGTVLGVVSTVPPAVHNTIAAFKGNEIIALTLQNALNPFAVLSANPGVRINNLSIAILSIIQSIGSIATGALALLALRLKFQRGGG